MLLLYSGLAQARPKLFELAFKRPYQVYAQTPHTS